MANESDFINYGPYPSPHYLLIPNNGGIMGGGGCGASVLSIISGLIYLKVNVDFN
jgi:hypothetical protein